MPAVARPQMTETEPPEGSASEREAARAVQELRMAKARPSMVHRLKVRLKDSPWPSWASWFSSVVARGSTFIVKEKRKDQDRLGFFGREKRRAGGRTMVRFTQQR